jgi:pimeloyl-ACP methyl ester carboxylesterase
MMTGRRFVVIVSAIALVGVMLAAAPGAGAAPPAPTAASVAAKRWRDPGSNPVYDATLARYATQHLAWRPCLHDGSAPEFQCASVTAPMDWGHPQKGNIKVAISRVLATGARHGLLETNPGGPGGSGLFMPQYIEEAEPQVAAHFDVIGMDPRGVGASTELECQGTAALEKLYALDGRDRSPANTAKFLNFSKKEADGCASDPRTPYINTDQTVRDVDLIRAIFGEAKTSWIGFSGGTWMGAWYATLFPSHVDRFLLDGNPDWTTTWYDGVLRPQPAGFQRRFDQDLVPWLAKYNSLLHLGGTAAKVTNTFNARRAALNKHPLRLADGSRLTGVDYESDIVGYLYFAPDFPDLANAMSIIERYATATPHEQKKATSVFGAFPLDQTYHVFWSVICNDTPMPPQSVVFTDWRTLGVQNPLTGASWLALPCMSWKLPSIGSPVTGQGIPPVLMLQNDGDPATPYKSGLQAHLNTPGSVLLTVRHEGDHTIYGDGDACVDNIANAWLVHGILPKHDLSCEGIPLPDLTAGSASAGTVASASPATTALSALRWGEHFARDHLSLR